MVVEGGRRGKCVDGVEDVWWVVHMYIQLFIHIKVIPTSYPSPFAKVDPTFMFGISVLY